MEDIQLYITVSIQLHDQRQALDELLRAAAPATGHLSTQSNTSFGVRPLSCFQGQTRVLLPSLPTSILSSSKESPVLELFTGLLWGSIFHSHSHPQRGSEPSTSAATCRHHPVPEPGQGSHISRRAVCTLPAPCQCPAVTLFCMATLRGAVKHSDELNNTRQCTV